MEAICLFLISSTAILEAKKAVRIEVPIATKNTEVGNSKVNGNSVNKKNNELETQATEIPTAVPRTVAARIKLKASKT